MTNTPLDATDLTWLAGLARALLGGHAEAEDLAQDTAVAALVRGIPPGVPRRTWLRAVAQRLAARRFRADGRRSGREAAVARPEAMPDATNLVERAEIAEQVTAAARRLSEPYRRTILLRFLEGHTAEEIAQEEGKPADTVRWRLRRGLALLREELTQHSGKDWSVWSSMLVPLARPGGSAGLAAAGASSGALVSAASWIAMKSVLTLVVAMGCVGLWWALGSGGEGGSVADALSGEENLNSTPPVGRSLAVPGDPRTGTRTFATLPREPLAVEEEDQAPAPGLRGSVVDEAGRAIAGASICLLSSPKGPEPGELGPVIAQTTSAFDGSFGIASDDLNPEGWLEPALALSVAANRYESRVLERVLQVAADDGLVVVLGRGRTLAGRVVDEYGTPVADLELLVYSAYAGITHVSPSQMRMRAQRRTHTSAGYGQCLAQTDGRGEVEFSGLPAGDWMALSLDPGWEILDSQTMKDVEPYVLWTAQRRLGVRLEVIEASTGLPVERASATFCLGVTFADGEELDLSQWVGRGKGEVSFVLGSETLPGLEERILSRVAFYGTVRSGTGAAVDWAAEPLEDAGGVTGVARVRVEVDSNPVAPLAVGGDVPETVQAEMVTLDLDVRYPDSAPFEGELRANWNSVGTPAIDGDSRLKAVALGRYRLEVPAGEVRLELSDSVASGTLAPWSQSVRCPANQATAVFVTLPRGSSATVVRPARWNGEWFLRASYREEGTEEWRGAWGYSTAQTRLTLTVLRPAEWRFELRRENALEREPIVRIVMVGEGESVVAD